MNLPNTEQLARRFAGSRLGRVGVTYLLGVLTVQAVTQLRGLVGVVDALGGRDAPQPCTGCAERHAAAVPPILVDDVASSHGPGEPVDGMPLAPFAGDELDQGAGLVTPGALVEEYLAGE